MFHKKYAFSYSCSMFFVILYLNVLCSMCEDEVPAPEGGSKETPNDKKQIDKRIVFDPRNQAEVDANDNDKGDNDDKGDQGDTANHDDGSDPRGGKKKYDKEQGQEEPELEVGGADLKLKLDELMTVPPMPFVTNPNYLIFEGVDYDLIANQSIDFYNEYYDCFYWFTHCVRDMSNFHMVCAYANAYHWVTFSNLCQIDLLNCRYRVRVERWKTSQGIYGTPEGDYYDYQYLNYYHGDGYNCKYWDLRRSSVRDDRLNFYIEEDQQTMDSEGNGTIPMLH